MVRAVLGPHADRFHREERVGQEEDGGAAATAARGSTRLQSLDVMRGLTVAGMILVNNPGSWDDGYAFLSHSAWHGWTLADLVFPFFLLIVGVSLDLSLAERLAGTRERSRVLPTLARRGLLLFALGLLLNGFPDFGQLASLRIFGVLQRIGMCSVAATAVMLATGVRGRAATVVFLLTAYWMLLTLVPVPGFGAGVLTPEGNLAAYVDGRWFAGHLYHRGFDPEGLVSTIPAVATTLLGVLAGSWLRADVAAGRKTMALVVGGALLAVAGQLADAWFPINKQLWTSSFVLLSAGLGYVLLGLCHELIDRRRWRRGTTPFLMLGSNALAVYLLSSLGARLMELSQVPIGDSYEPLRFFLYEHLFAPVVGAREGSFCFALAYLLIWMLPTAELHRRRIFIRV